MGRPRRAKLSSKGLWCQKHILRTARSSVQRLAGEARPQWWTDPTVDLPARSRGGTSSCTVVCCDSDLGLGGGASAALARRVAGLRLAAQRGSGSQRGGTPARRAAGLWLAARQDSGSPHGGTLEGLWLAARRGSCLQHCKLKPLQSNVKVGSNLGNKLKISVKQGDLWTAAELNAIITGNLVGGPYDHLHTFGHPKQRGGV